MNASPSVLENYLDLLETLPQNATPEWGAMTAQRMVEHLFETLAISNGRAQVPCMISDEQIPAAKQRLYDQVPLPRNFQNPMVPPDKPLRQPDIQTAVQKLRAEVLKFYQFYIDNPKATPTHPLFGPLNLMEWEMFHNLHFRHHLQQFGLLN